LLVLLSKGLSRSLFRELNSFFGTVQQSEYSIAEVTKGALTHARRKLKPEAFKELNQEGLRSFYQDAPWLKWRGHRLLSCDGSTLVLPRHQSIIEEFGEHGFGSKADSKNSLATVSLVYDVLNLTTLDAQIGGYTTSERALLDKHLAQTQFEPNDLLLLDRGYAGIGLMYELQQQGRAFCMRLTDDWWKEVRCMIEKAEKDKIVTFPLPAKDRHLREKYNTKVSEVKCRLLVIELEGGVKEVLCTSLLDQQQYEYECFKQLYHYRWQIEEGYKLFKCRASLEVFSGKTAQAVKQDIFAKVFMMTMCAILSFPIEQKVRAEYKTATTKYPKKINRTDALSITKETWIGLFIKKTIKPALKAIDNILIKSSDILRPNRKFERKKRTKKPPSMNYKQL
jgi:hypothetical protein